MKELSIEEKAKAYDKIMGRAKKELDACGSQDCDAAKQIFRLFPELMESEDERIRKEIIEYLKSKYESPHAIRCDYEKWIAWLEKQGEHANFINKIQIGDKVTRNEDGVLVNLSQLKRVAKKDEKQGEQKPRMIQWKGNNLNEVIAFTGKDKNFDKWFASFEEYEKYVHEHNDIFKLFNEDGSHYEVPVGAWIFKTPDGYNVPSKAKYIQKPADKVEPKFKVGDKIIEKDFDECGCGTIIGIKDGKYIFDDGSFIYIKEQGLWKLIEQKSANWFQELEDKLANATPQQLAEWKEKYFKEEPAEWSEEDERNLQGIIDEIEANKDDAPDYDLETYDRFLSWLKSIKERYIWKPSDEQMEMLENIRKILHANEDIYSESNHLMYNFEELIRQLNKLKE